MVYELAPLPFEINALEPVISRETLEYHHGKHHQAYVTNLNNLVRGTEFEEMSLEDIIIKSSGGIFNNAAQVWNHAFYWKCLAPEGTTKPSESLLAKINEFFGSFEMFKEEFSKTAIGTFGSGWAWLVQNEDDSLTIESTSNASNPLVNKQKPLLTCDVWEHAYYIDFRNVRPEYIEKFWSIVNWDFVEENMK